MNRIGQYSRFLYFQELARELWGTHKGGFWAKAGLVYLDSHVFRLAAPGEPTIYISARLSDEEIEKQIRELHGKARTAVA